MLAIFLLIALVIQSIGLFRILQTSIHNYGREYFEFCFLPDFIYRRLKYFFLFNLCILFVSSWYLSHWQIIGISLLLICGTGILLFDYLLKIIPDYMHFVGILGAIIWQLSSGVNLMNWAAGSLAAFMIPVLLLGLNHIYEWKTGRWGLGLGDIKLLAWLPLLMGSSMITAFKISLILAVIFQIKRILNGRRHEAFAFGPYIVYAVVFMLAEKSLALQFWQFQ